jgi:hypothetical protein
MALGKTVATILSNKTAAASGSTTLSDCTTLDTSDVLMLGIDASANYHASATSGVTVKVFASRDDSSYNLNPCDEWDLPFVAGTVVSKTVPVIPAGRYLKVQVTNKDTGQSATQIYVYAHPLRG